MSSHFLVRSTLSRTGARSVTVMIRRCSPSSAFRNTTSCGPTVSGKLPIGVSPMFSPSMDTLAQGMAFKETVPFGSVTLDGGGAAGRHLHGAHLPEAHQIVDKLDVVLARRQHDPVDAAVAEKPAVLLAGRRRGVPSPRASRTRPRRAGGAHRHDERRLHARLNHHLLRHASRDRSRASPRALPARARRSSSEFFRAACRRC